MIEHFNILMHNASFGIDLGLLGLDPPPLRKIDGTKENKWVEASCGKCCSLCSND